MSVNGRQFLSAALQNAGSVIETRYGILQGRLSDRVTALPLTVSWDIEETDVMGWLKHQPLFPRVYWSSRNGEFEAACIGAAVDVAAAAGISIGNAHSRIGEILQLCDDDSVLFLGGQAFDTSFEGDSLWSNFPKLRFVVPEVLVTRKGDRHTVTAAVKVDAECSLDDVLSRLQGLLAERDFRSAKINRDSDTVVVSRNDCPDFHAWRGNVAESLEMIERRDIEKVVIARKTNLNFTDKIDPFRLLAALKSANGNCFGLMFEPEAGHTFTGVTPERLFRLDSGRIESEAISGTAFTGKPVSGGRLAGEELLSSDKNAREHGFVLDYVVEKLGELCDVVGEPSVPTVLNLSNVSHIYSSLSGRLRPGLSIKDVVGCLHPTPAVCGVSRENALRFIRELEPFERGWYAGPFGVIGRDFSEMAVAIRSALVLNDRVSLFAGSGIVKGSVADVEWEELEHKIAPALEILGGVLV